MNGRIVRDYGTASKDDYHIFIKNTLIPLPDENVDIIIQVANYSHYYSGLIYPPLLGTSDAITFNVICRLIFYAFLCFFTLGCAVVSFTVWFRRQVDSMYAAYGILCLAFAIHVSYPLVHWMGLNAGVFPYIVEDTAYFIVLTCMTILTYRFCKALGAKNLHIIFYVFSILMTLFPMIAFYIVFPVFPRFVSVYGLIIGGSKILISFYLIFAALINMIYNRRHIWLLSGNVILGIGILFDYLSAGSFEPKRFGWPLEYCGFFMVLLFTALILDYNRKALNEKEHLTYHLQNEVERKTAYLTSMIEERKQFLSSVAHDLKAPVAAINTYVDYIRNTDSNIDTELSYYLDVIDRKSSQIQDDVKNLQLFHVQDTCNEKAEVINLNDFLEYVYMETLPYADANGIYYKIELPELSCHISGKKNSLFRALENIILNATEHTPLDGTITMRASYSPDKAYITITDNGEGISPENLSKIFDYEFSTRDTKGLNGLGLYFAKITIEEYGGSISVISEPNIATTFSISFCISST